MKLQLNLAKRIFPPLALGLAVFALAGCKTHTTVAPVGNGYEEVSHPHYSLMDEPVPPRVSFQYRAADGGVTEIWPSLYDLSVVIKGQMAIFVVEKAYVEPARVTHPRLFAVTAPEVPLDLTDEVLWRWSRLNGRDFGQTMNRFSQVTPAERNGRLELLLEFMPENGLLDADRDWPDQSVLPLSWNEVSEIIQNVKKKGVEQKDLRWHTSYIGEKL